MAWRPASHTHPTTALQPPVNQPTNQPTPSASTQVFRVRHRASGEVFAVKRSRRRFRSKLQRERCLREIRAVAALPPHPNIVNQYRAWQEGGHFYIQMDFCEGGSLGQQAQQVGGRAGGCGMGLQWCRSRAAVAAAIRVSVRVGELDGLGPGALPKPPALHQPPRPTYLLTSCPSPCNRPAQQGAA